MTIREKIEICKKEQIKKESLRKILGKAYRAILYCENYDDKKLKNVKCIRQLRGWVVSYGEYDYKTEGSTDHFCSNFSHNSTSEDWPVFIDYKECTNKDCPGYQDYLKYHKALKAYNDINMEKWPFYVRFVAWFERS